MTRPSWRQPKPAPNTHAAEALRIIDQRIKIRTQPEAKPAPQRPVIDNVSLDSLTAEATTRLRTGLTLTHTRDCGIYAPGAGDWLTACDCFVSRAKIVTFADGTDTAIPYEYVASLYSEMGRTRQERDDAKALWQHARKERDYWQRFALWVGGVSAAALTLMIILNETGII